MTEHSVAGTTRPLWGLGIQSILSWTVCRCHNSQCDIQNWARTAHCTLHSITV